MTEPVSGCLVCDEVSGAYPVPGGLVLAQERVAGFHVPPMDESERPYLGHLLVVPRRHVLGLDELADEDAADLGVAVARLSRALRSTLELERVYSMVIGHGVPHLHVHLLPRYVGTPPDTGWLRVDEWEGAPHGGAREIVALSSRLRRALQGDGT